MAATVCRNETESRVLLVAPDFGMDLANTFGKMKSRDHSCKERAATHVAGVLLLIAWPGLLAAGQWQEAASIRAAAEDAARTEFAASAAKVSVVADALDPRLLMPACDQPLAGTVPGTSQEPSRVAVEVRCQGTRTWRLFVPVRVSVEKDILVAAVPLERGKVLAAGDVILAQREVAAAPGGYLTNADAAVGKVVRRAVPAGAALSPAWLEAPVLIRRGQSVALEARSGAITVSMAGVARSDGTLGQTIGVENLSSRRVVQGIVRNEKSVEVLVP